MSAMLLSGMAVVAMVCSGSEQQLNSTSARTAKFTESIGVDEATSQWCEDPCSSMKPIQKVSGSLNILKHAQGPGGNPYVLETLDVFTGAFEDTFLLDGFGLRRKGTCVRSQGQ